MAIPNKGDLRCLGWTERQYEIAAASCGLLFDPDGFATAYVDLALCRGAAAAKPLIDIKRAWLRRGGPITGPAGTVMV